MIKDGQLVFSRQQAVTTTAASTDLVDLGQTGLNYGAGYPPFVFALVNEAFTSAGAATLTVELQESDVEGSGYVTIAATGAVPKADLTPGVLLKVRIPDKHKRFLRVNYVASATMTAGKIDAFVGIER